MMDLLSSNATHIGVQWSSLILAPPDDVDMGETIIFGVNWASFKVFVYLPYQRYTVTVS